MLMTALICMFIATTILAAGLCFVGKSKTLGFLLQTLSLVALLCLGFVACNYKNNFSGFSILLVLSIAPQFLSVFDLKEYLQERKLKIETNSNSNDISNIEKNDFEENINEDKKEKKVKKHVFLNSNGSLLSAIAILMTSICIGFCGLYLGIETFYGFLIGLAIAFALTFLVLIIKKSLNIYDLLSYFLMFLAIGILLGQMITVLLYSLSLVNILFCVGCVLMCVYISLTTFIKTNFNHIAYFLAMFCLFCTLVF